jgi:CRP/FNR family cyclic AMP-dependent transcriptional regulator
MWSGIAAQGRPDSVRLPRVKAGGVDFIEGLGRLALFADLADAELEEIARRCEQVSFKQGEWVIRQGDPPSAFYVIVDGEVSVMIGDDDRGVLSRGSFFGEVSVLLEEPASASIMTRTPLTCLVVPGEEVQSFLVAHPEVSYRILRAEARRLRTASQWRT